MSFIPDDTNETQDTQNADVAEESLRYLKVIAVLLAEMQDADINQLLNDTKGL